MKSEILILQVKPFAFHRFDLALRRKANFTQRHNQNDSFGLRACFREIRSASEKSGSQMLMGTERFSTAVKLNDDLNLIVEALCRRIIR
jgi:hypothetical protein